MQELELGVIRSSAHRTPFHRRWDCRVEECLPVRHGRLGPDHRSGSYALRACFLLPVSFWIGSPQVVEGHLMRVAHTLTFIPVRDGVPIASAQPVHSVPETFILEIQRPGAENDGLSSLPFILPDQLSGASLHFQQPFVFGMFHEYRWFDGWRTSPPIVVSVLGSSMQAKYASGRHPAALRGDSSEEQSCAFAVFSRSKG